MLRSIYTLILLVCSFLALSNANAATNLVPLPISQAVQDRVADGLLVKFRANTSKSSQLHALSASGLKTIERFELVPGLTHVKQVAGENLLSTLSSIKSDPNVEYAEPNYLVTIQRVPDDPKFVEQYALDNTGQTGGSFGADISAPEAWDISTGTDVIVAVIDTGVEYIHSELRLNMWKNPGEIAGNNIDDDSNGFIDDIYGWDFSNNDADPMDDMGHGTHVAGIVAAKGNNGIGIAGINWNARIMALKFIDVNGVGATSNAIKALNYAVAMGARVSNNSWGGGGFSQALFDSIAAAENAGHIFVAASGNSSENSDDPAISLHYPSSYPMNNVISVTATDEIDQLGSYANYGAISVDLAAPGSQINSLWIKNAYVSLDGTSMAAPFVTGAVALLWSLNPRLSIAEVRSAILDNIDLLPSLSGVTVTGGRLNLHKAMLSINVEIRVNSSTNYLSVDDTLLFNAVGGTPPYSWLISDNNIARIDQNSGVLSALQPGMVRVIATDAMGFKGSSTEIIIEKLVVQPELAFINAGDTLQFSVSGGVAPYTWSLTNPQVAQIDRDTGLLTAIAAGQTFVNVVDSKGISTQSGIVDVVFVPDLTVSPLTKSAVVGEKLPFFAIGGITPYSWKSSNSAIATINKSTGELTAVSPGIIQISVTDATGNVRSTNDIVIQDLSITSQIDSMRINETQLMTVSGGVEPFEWFVSNSLVANIDSFGNLTAIGAGSVKVSLRDGNGLLASTDMILISDSSALSMQMDTSILTINDVVNAVVTGGVVPYRWTSSNPSVLKIDNGANLSSNTNKVRAVGAGIAYVSIKDAIGEVVSSAITEVRDISISSQRNAYLVGETEQFFASGGAAPYSWQVDNTSIASINRDGTFQAKAVGSVNVGVVDGDGIRGMSKLITVNSNNTILHALSVAPYSVVLSKRSTTTVTFVASGGLAPYEFSLSNPIGRIDPNTGVYIPTSTTAGTTSIIVTDADGHAIESGVVELR